MVAPVGRCCKEGVRSGTGLVEDWDKVSRRGMGSGLDLDLD
jgi:hypothetical protein